MTTVRLGVVLMAIGIALLLAGALNVANDDFLDIGGVGCLVLGAVAVCIATDAPED